MKKLIFLVLIVPILFLSFTPDKDKKIEAKLISIEYYSKSICKVDYPVYIRVKYAVKNSKVETLKMRHSFANGVTATIPISEIDKKGNVVYGFCSSKEEIKSFSTIFLSPKGAKSKEIIININVPDAKIIAGTAPKTIKK